MTIAAETEFKFDEIVRRGKLNVPRKFPWILRFLSAWFGDFYPDRCPRCGSTDIHRMTTPGVWGHSDHFACHTCNAASTLYTSDY